MKYKLLLAAPMAVIVTAITTKATAAEWATGIRVLPPSEWPQFLYMDVGPFNQNCAKEGGDMHQLGIRPICTISPKDCVQKPGWQVIERDSFRTGSARVKTCHRMPSP